MTSKSSGNRIKAFAVDIDGTLLTRDHRISEPTAEAVQLLRAKGVEMIPASARGPLMLRPIVEELGCYGWAIANSGATICEIRQETQGGIRFHRQRNIPHDAVQALLRQAKELGISASWFQDEYWFVEAMDPAIAREAAIVGVMPTVAPAFGLPQAGVQKVQLISDGDEAHRRLQTLAHALPGGCEGRFSNFNYLEIVAAGVHKGSALQELLHLLGCPVEQAAAIGDGEVDVPMLQLAGLGIAMGHAAPAVLAAADWVTESNEHEGFARAVQRLERDGRLS